MIQKWNRFNEGASKTPKGIFSSKSNNDKSDKLKSLLTEMRDDVGLNRSDIEQLVISLVDDFDFSISDYSEGITNGHCDVESNRFGDHSLAVKPMLKSYHAADDLRNRNVEDPEKKAVILNNMSLNSLEETIQGNDRLFYCYFITLSSNEPSAYDNDSFEDIKDLNDYAEIFEELSSIKKRAASLIGGYCQLLIYYELVGICIYKEIDKSKYLDATRPYYYSKFPAEVRDDIHKLIIDERIGTDGVDKLLEIISKIK